MRIASRDPQRDADRDLALGGIVPGGQVEPSEVSSPIESPRWTPESLMNSYSSPTNDELMNSHLNLMKENEQRE